MEKNFQLLLSYDIFIYKSYNGKNISTINLLFTSNNLTNKFRWYNILMIDYKLDHWSIASLF